MNKPELEKSLNFQIGAKCVLVTFHPVTLEKNTAGQQIENLLRALESIPDLRVIFTMPNSDTNGRIIIQMINQFVENNTDRSVAFASLGHVRYLSTLLYVSAVVGNSSSGIIEAPSFGVPTLNIGDRQKGRLKAETVVDCDSTFEDISLKLSHVLTKKFLAGCKKRLNPYEKANTATEILNVIKNTPVKNLITKKFYNL